MILKKVAATLAVAALAAVGAITAAPAMAATVEYKSWVEHDDTTPIPVTHGLVFYKNAGINFGDGTEADHNTLVPLADLDGLAYTVAETTNSATSYQIGIVSDTITYARLVWVPAAQVPKQAETGVYTDLEHGRWWANNVWVKGEKTTPFAGSEGSQGQPAMLNFFIKTFGDDAKVDFFGLSEGLSNENTSVVTSLTFEGNDVPLGKGDDTPFSAKDVKAQVAAATAPLTSKIDALEAELKEYKASHQTSNTDLKENYVDTADGAMSKWALVEKKLYTDYMADHQISNTELKENYVDSADGAKTKWALVEKKLLTDNTAEFDAYKASHPLTTEGAREGYVNTGDAAKDKWKLVDAKDLADYTASHPYTTAEAREGYVNTADAAKAKWNLVEKASLVTAASDAATAKAKIVSISGTEKVGKTVTARTESITGAIRTYQWYASTKLVKGATNASFKLARSRANHSLYVTVTTTWTDALGGPHSVTAIAKHMRTALVAR